MSEESVANLLKGCSEVIFRDVVEPIERLYCERKELSSYADIEALEQEIGGLIGRLGALLMRWKLQEVVQSEAFQEQEAAFIKQLPGRWVSEGYREVTIRTCWGEIRVNMRYFRRKCPSAKARRKGIHPAQVLWGIIQGCTPPRSDDATIPIGASRSF